MTDKLNISSLIIRSRNAGKNDNPSAEDITYNQPSIDALSYLFNTKNNRESCSLYGGGNHCDNEDRNKLKLTLWGDKGEKADLKSCAVAKVYFMNNVPAAINNVGLTGAPATVIDRSHGDHAHQVYEFSGIFMADYYLATENQEEAGALINFILDDLKSCAADSGFTKGILTVAPDNHYQIKIFKALGAQIINQDNLLNILGENSMHPERFNFKNGTTHECTTWNKEVLVEHYGWHNSNQCSAWTNKTILALGITENHFDFHSDL
jgi:hypothetical protein